MATFKTKKSKSTGKTYVAFVIDESGSMGHLANDVVASFNEQIAKLKEESRKNNQETTVSLWTFNYEHNIQKHFTNLPIEEIEPWFITEYSPGGNTALRSAVYQAVLYLERNTSVNDDDAYLLIVITDGQENDSTTGRNAVLSRLQFLNATDKWTFVFIGPYGSRQELTNQFGALPGNVIEWEQTRQGVRNYTGQTVNALGGYMTLRAAGVRSTQSFFQPDLSKVTAKQVKKNLDDVTYEYSEYKVPKECEIKDLVSSKRGAYTLGSAYYELTKKETVQDYKKLLLMDRKTNEIFGGDVRDFLGVPSGAGVVTKIEPGNHANWRIFVQSTSTNRKLVRGTSVLVAK